MSKQIFQKFDVEFRKKVIVPTPESEMEAVNKGYFDDNMGAKFPVKTIHIDTYNQTQYPNEDQFYFLQQFGGDYANGLVESIENLQPAVEPWADPTGILNVSMQGITKHYYPANQSVVTFGRIGVTTNHKGVIVTNGVLYVGDEYSNTTGIGTAIPKYLVMCKNNVTPSREFLDWFTPSMLDSLIGGSLEIGDRLYMIGELVQNYGNQHYFFNVNPQVLVVR